MVNIYKDISSLVSIFTQVILFAIIRFFDREFYRFIINFCYFIEVIANFNNLKIWQDKNSDGKLDEGELLSLSEAGVRSLNTQF
jgi:hypothetical protein